MIESWTIAIPAIAAAAAITLVPGALLLRVLLGLRGLALFALAPLASVAMLAISALGLGLVVVPWSPLSVLVVLAVMVAAGWGLGKILRPPANRTHGPAYRWGLPVAIALGVVISAWRLIAYIQDPAGISQTNDSVFHMNAIRYVLDTANASSLHVSSVIGGTGFYPSAWHAVVSMTVMVSGSQIAVAANAATLVIGALIWPLGLGWMAYVATQSERIAALTAILASALQAFPLLMFQWGVLFPNALSIALLPAAVAAVMMLSSRRDAGRRSSSIVRAVVVFGIAACALAFSQPAALPVWGLIIVIWFSDQMLRVHRATTSVGRRVTVALGAWFALILAWVLIARMSGRSHWPPFRGKWEALVDILLNRQVGISAAWFTSILMIVGLVAVARRSSWRWLGVVWLGLSALYVLVAAIGMPLIRNVFLGPWYADPYRLAALAPVIVIPLAAIGLDMLAGYAVGLVSARSGELAVAAAGPVVAVVGVVLITLLKPVPMPAFLQGTFDEDSRYLTTTESYLSADERAFLESLSAYVPPGVRVIANPSTGAGFGYMLSGRDVYPRTWSPPSSPAWTIVADALRDAEGNPAVCNALIELGRPAFVLDFGEGDSGPGRFLMPGMTNFNGQAGFDLVTARGGVSLWRITACES